MKHNGLAGKHRRLYSIWYQMHHRCTNQKNIGYFRYGGRGIRVCTEWNSFTLFVDWALANGYADSLSIDRINNDLGYSPDNCKWSTRIEQCRNKSTNVLIEMNGVTKCIKEWAIQYNLCPVLLSRRLKRGWNLQKALTERIEPRARIITAFGKTQNLAAWAKELKISADVIALRIASGLSLEESLTSGDRRKHKHTINGETHSVLEWAKIVGLNRATIHRRIREGRNIFSPSHMPKTIKRNK